MLKAFRKIRVKDAELEAVQTNIAQSIVPLLRSPIVDGNLVKAALVSGDNRVSHGLGRVPEGWIIVDRSMAATIYRDPDKITDSSTMTLTASGTILTTIWFF